MKKKKTRIPPPLPALSLVGSTRFTYTFSRILLVLLFGFIFALLFVPWRQSVIGNGRVIAFDPLERKLNMESQLAGRVKALHVMEGQAVKKGELIAEIEDNDPLLMEHLKLQREAIKNRQQFAESKEQEISLQEQQLKLSKASALLSAQEKTNAQRAKLHASSLEYERLSKLHQKGLASRKDYEQARMLYQSSEADLKSAKSLLNQTNHDYEASLAVIRAKRESINAEIEATQQEILSLDIKINQTSRQVITSPREGIIYKVAVTDGSYLTPGKLICSIIPKTDSRYVEIWLDGNDIALIHARDKISDPPKKGSLVRLAFEGWPSIQAIGWPQLAVGTFGGEVVFIDSASDNQGSFRVVIGPHHDYVDRYDGQGRQQVPWPDKERWLRQGTLTQAWFLLEEVPLWLEIWRNINGFPPLPNREDAS